MPINDDPLLTTVDPSDILAAGLSPKIIKGDQGEITERSIDELIAARNAAAAATASTLGHRGLRFTKLVPEGAD